MSVLHVWGLEPRGNCFSRWFITNNVIYSKHLIFPCGCVVSVTEVHHEAQYVYVTDPPEKPWASRLRGASLVDHTLHLSHIIAEWIKHIQCDSERRGLREARACFPPDFVPCTFPWEILLYPFCCNKWQLWIQLLDPLGPSRGSIKLKGALGGPDTWPGWHSVADNRNSSSWLKQKVLIMYSVVSNIVGMGVKVSGASRNNF